MLRLAWANLLHHKIRTALSVLAVAIAITLLLILVGLAHGTLNDVSRRMESVEAQILVRDAYFDLGSLSGGKLWEKEIPRLLEVKLDQQPAVERVMPVFLGRMKLAGQSQNVFGIAPQDFPYFIGSRRLVDGGLFTDADSARELLDRFEQAGTMGDTTSPAYMPLIVDQRLAAAGDLHVGSAARYGDLDARVVGIVQTGVAGRVFAPINTLRAANGVAVQTAHLFFVKAAGRLSTDQLLALCERIEQATARSATLVADYGRIMKGNFRTLILFVDLVSLIALVICFLFILVTIYTSVLERCREIAILQSLGATRRRILLQTVQEALLLCVAGTLLGIGLTFAVRYGIETARPLMTVEIRASWLLGATAVGIGGGILSSLYPGYVALRHDPVEALSFE
ncbi:MAG: ABC transporter permease [Sedimentisphaerales bacterium]|nr:ABC transporter permease [Sedimentisphaerales bacterium]